MSKTLQYVLVGFIGGIIGGLVDVIFGKAGASAIIFGIIIVIGGTALYFANKNR